MVPGGLTRNTVPLAQYESLMKKPEWRDPRAYVLSAAEGDFLTSAKFVNALLKTGVVVHRATAPFSAGGKQYPAGSYVVKTAQAFRPHVLDMFEPQDHPERLPVSGRPADSALRQRRMDAGLSDGREVRSRCSTASTARSKRFTTCRSRRPAP